MEKINFNKKKFKYGSLATVITVVVIAIIVVINVILEIAADKVNMKIDLTQDQIFQISQDSIDYLNTLSEDDNIEIIAMADESVFENSSYVYYKQAYEVLKKYVANSDKVTLKFVDMTKDPTYIEQFKVMYSGQISEYSIIVRHGDRMKVFSIQDLYNVEVDQNTYEQKITSSKAEQVITSAIMYVTDPSLMKAVIFDVQVAGSDNTNITTMLDRNGYEVVTINPLNDPIPEDATIVVINAPLNDFPEDLVQRVYEYLENDGKYGKNLMYIADYNQNATPNIDAFLSEWGIDFGDGVIFETQQDKVVDKPYEVKTYISDTIYDTFAQNVVNKENPAIAYYARPVNLSFATSGKVTTMPLLCTSNSSYVLTQELYKEFQEGNKEMPATSVQNVMTSSEKKSSDGTAKSTILAVGSSYLFDTYYTGATYYNNGEFFISSVNNITGKSAGITIVPKDFGTERFDIDLKTYNACKAVFVYIIPSAVIIAGVAIWLKRRRS